MGGGGAADEVGVGEGGGERQGWNYYLLREGDFETRRHYH